MTIEPSPFGAEIPPSAGEKESARGRTGCCDKTSRIVRMDNAVPDRSKKIPGPDGSAPNGRHRRVEQPRRRPRESCLPEDPDDCRRCAFARILKTPHLAPRIACHHHTDHFRPSVGANGLNRGSALGRSRHGCDGSICAASADPRRARTCNHTPSSRKSARRTRVVPQALLDCPRAGRHFPPC